MFAREGIPMHTRTNGGGLALAAGLTLLACQTMTPQLGPMSAPAEAYPNAVTDDDTVPRSMAEGGQSDQPYVLDGTVQSLTEHSILIEVDDLGNKQLFVNRRTKITVDGKPAALSDIRPGTRIRAAYSPTRVAWALQAGEGATPRDQRR
jgi:hypothetical protein